MNLLQIKYFVEVATQQSLAKAAKILFVSPSTLSVAISNLENSLKTKLFYRNNTGMYLTDAGKLIFEDAKTIISLLDSWPLKLHPQLEEISGSIHIISRPLITESLLIDVTQTVKTEYPNLQIIIEDKLFTVDTFLNSKANIAFAIISKNGPTYDEIDKKLKAASFQSELLCQVTLHVFLNPENPLVSKDNITPEDLKPYYFVTLSDTEAFVERSDISHPVISSFPLSHIVSMPNRNAIMRYVENNSNSFALLLSNTEIDEKYAYGEEHLIKKPFEADFYTDDIYLVYPDKPTITLAEKYVVETIKELI